MTYLIDRSGKIVATYVGLVDRGNCENAISRLLEKSWREGREWARPLSTRRVVEGKPAQEFEERYFWKRPSEMTSLAASRVGLMARGIFEAGNDGRHRGARSQSRKRRATYGTRCTILLGVKYVFVNSSPWSSVEVSQRKRPGRALPGRGYKST